MNRVLLRIMVAGLLLVVSGLIGWRVLAPAELSAVAKSSKIPSPSVRQGVAGRLSLAPLVVDGRLRVYAAKHQVRADGPADRRAVYTPRWSFRRWPAQLSAVVAVGTTVVTRWSDGKLVGIDSYSGKVMWRADGPSGPGFAAHRTGAEAVWNPPGLRVAAGTVVVTQGQDLAGYAATTGQSTWKTSVPAGCAEGFTTAGNAYVCATGAYDAMTGVPLAGWPPGPYQPVGCWNSECEAFRDGSGQGWLATAATPRRVPALDDPAATIAAGIIVTPWSSAATAPSPPAPIPAPSTDSVAPSPAGSPVPSSASPSASPPEDAPAEAGVSGRALDGTLLWTLPGKARVLGGNRNTVLLLSPKNYLNGVDVRTGKPRFWFRLVYRGDKTENINWKPGLYHVTEGFLAMERLNKKASDDPESPNYYLSLDAVVIAALPDEAIQPPR
ncbi:PQQ-binding-like beta-propeller repeat protein [Actinoplanes sp. NEAU-A12]|uniref:PQQ-binding-like beta-propeller repeat protein n=1 Tax=Actinoplanes sandaracinus TaxID=3045177 RepID=A0ABT6WVR7_9ACTN|nr:PQQ-binding-like beta-propeller repeat protein [Actinoplanes sandaracinus]MDI6103831.1 PQQ-binding-like beta-propeller repeat protein [Actinoplanes sandaracinus]